MNYRIIPIFLVKSFERCIVTWTAAIVARDLNTAIPRIDFIRQCSEKADLHFDGNLLGLCTKGGEQIYLLRDMRPEELAKTVAHEIRHCWQKKNQTATGPIASGMRGYTSANFGSSLGIRAITWLSERWLTRVFSCEPSRKRA
jgi:hypothetical protein